MDRAPNRRQISATFMIGIGAHRRFPLTYRKLANTPVIPNGRKRS
jgi:hypothetical protein